MGTKPKCVSLEEYLDERSRDMTDEEKNDISRRIEEGHRVSPKGAAKGVVSGWDRPKPPTRH
jgi:hypothetical protein